MTGIRIYVEGGGDGKDTKAAIRAGFSAFLGELRDAARQRRVRWDLIACGSRGSAFDDFRTACRSHPDSLNVLLVDSEGPVTMAARQHLRTRDGWYVEVPEEQCHLMVQAMEAWIIADLEALRGFYGKGFLESAIPRTGDVEQIDKERLETVLKGGSRNTSKGPYHKIHHGGRLLERLNPAVVRSKARHCDRLFAAILDLVERSDGA